MISIGFSNSVQLVVLLILCVHVALAKKGPTECEKRAHTSFTAQQREQLCSGASPGSIGPAVCASAAKDSLHLKFDEILVLCAGAINAAPAQCMNSLDQANRKKHGFQLCEKAYSPLSAECFKELTAFKGKRLKLESVVDFCSSLEDRAPLSCMMAVASTTLLPIDQAIFPCSNAVGNGFTDSLSHEGNNNATAACIYDMKALLTSSMGISGLDALKFCVELTPHINQQSLRTIDQPELKYDALALQSAGVQSESVACLWYAMNAQQLKKDMSATSYYNSKQKLNLCKNAQSVLGPINCTNSALHRLSPADRPHADELATLCSGAIGIGPSNCFSESRGLGSIQDRIHLCNGAVSSGPAHCYRKSAALFKKDESARIMLCVGATSEDPAFCAANAPHYLVPNEKILLCGNTPPSRAQEPVQCLQSVQKHATSFQNSPKKALGYFIENLLLDSEKKSREILISMCSFMSSQDPLASAECFKSSPQSLVHDDVVRMCTNVSSAEIIAHIQLCHRILPKEWESEESSILCEDTSSRLQTENAVKCAASLTRFIFPPISRLESAKLCKNENTQGTVLACAKAVSSITASYSSSYILNGGSLIDTCSGGVVESGQCLAKLAALSRGKIIFDKDVPAALCNEKNPLSVLSCLEAKKTKLITTQILHECKNEERVLSSIRLKRILTEDNDVEVTSGRRFMVWFEVYDQWGAKFNDNLQDYMFSVSINNNNPQGAVMWGIRSNTSSNGVLHLNKLVISQPGAVEFKINVKRRNSDGSFSSAGEKQISGKVLEIFHMTVKEDPNLKETIPCIFVFREGFCPSTVPEADWVSEFPKIRSYSPSKHYLDNLHCSALLKEWHVDTFVGLDGSMWIEFRQGIDSIWTGIGMPRIEMSFEERLELSSHKDSESPAKNKANKREQQKAIRRAYYRKSLQWHPDRWTGMSMYAVAVQGVFELINEAYTALIALDSSSTDSTQKEEPVYN